MSFKILQRTKAATKVLGFALIGIVPTYTQAAPMYFTDEAAFLSAISDPLSIEGFNSLQVGGVNPSPTDFGAVSVTTQTGNIFGTAGSGNINIIEGTRAIEWSPIDNGNISFTFGTTINAFAIDLTDVGDVPGQAVNIGASLDGGAVVPIISFSDGDPARNLNQFFFGVFDPIGSFSSLTFSNGAVNESIGLDNLRFSPVAPVPLPASMWLLVFGLTGLFGWRRYAGAGRQRS